MKKYILSILLVLCSATLTHAENPFALQQRAQLSAKLIGVSVIADCPTPDVITELQEQGDKLHADYTVIPEVGGASLCPGTRWGQLWSTSRVNLSSHPNAAATGTWELGGAVTVGLHYVIGK